MFGGLKIFRYLCSVKFHIAVQIDAAVHRNVAAIFVSMP